MNQILSTAFNGLFLYLGLALAFMVLAGVLRSPRFKGWRGERAVQSVIRKKLDPQVYVDLHNVTLPTADGSTQIDHLIFSPYGIFVLETKNYQGWIFGGEHQAQWTQQIYRKRSKFQNPLRQNYKHTKALQELLGISAERVHSVIAFVGDCEFKTVMPPRVTRGDGFVAYIRSFTQTVWSLDEMQALLKRLEGVRLQPGRATNRQHLAHVKQLQAKKVLRGGRGAVEPAWTQAAEHPAAAPPVANASVRLPEDVPVCPQCAWPLRSLVMQRGPLAGQTVSRCCNVVACSFVRMEPPLNAAEPLQPLPAAARRASESESAHPAESRPRAAAPDSGCSTRAGTS